MFPHKITKVSPGTNERLMSHFGCDSDGFVQVGDQKWIFPAEYARHASGFYQFQHSSDDVWIMTFPRSGTTLCQELVWLLKNNLDFKKSAEIHLDRRAPFFEFNIICGQKFVQDVLDLNNHDPASIEHLNYLVTPRYKTWDGLISPRIIKTHLPFCLLSPSLLSASKVVYVARNPKDVLISYYHLCKLLKYDHFNYRGDLKTFWQFFKEDLVCWGPYWEHIKQAWDQRHHPNMLFIFYENLMRDMFSEVKTIAKFLNVKYSDEDLQQLVDHLEINNFRQKVPCTAPEVIKGISEDGRRLEFIRRGKTNGGDPELIPELSREIDEWIEANLQDTDFRFPVESH
ncbi:luciferin sulfotransferase isoform X2 [Bemisia tabaci]|uniref:luciferin sulfotransferase isoform X2 n=1 Tax=Bemisia tabaci TaxID=7038 RepID=UPI003B28598A